MSGAPSPGFDPSPWLAANAALAARISAGRSRGIGLPGIRVLDAISSRPGQTITGDRDEERRRRLPAIGPRGGRKPEGASVGLGGIAGRGVGASGWASRSETNTVSNAALLARGYQPAVVKIISHAHGTTRATASAQYIERDGVELETHDGLRLPDKAAVAEEIKAWSADFDKRSPSQDVVNVRLRLSGWRDNPEDRERLAAAAGAAFEGHRHALRIEVRASGEIEARAVVVMARTISPEEKAAHRLARAHGEKSPALPSRLRVVEKRMGRTEEAPTRLVFDTRSEAAMKARIETATGSPQQGISIEPGAPGHGRDALGQRLSVLVSKAPALDHTQRPISNTGDIREVTRDWGRHLRSQSPRDTMHMVVSARAGTDATAFTNAVRSFLHQQFADHKFMFGLHMDKAEAGHIHAHAIIAVRSESGPKLDLAPSDLAQLRVNYAAHAREYGLPIVATRAAEQASSRSYGRRDKAIVDAAANSRSHRMEQDRTYASDPRNANLIRNAQERMAIARANPVRIPMTGRERADVRESLEHWRVVAKADPTNKTARTMADRLAAAKEAGDMLDTLKTALSPKPAILNHPSANDKSRAPEMTENTGKSADAMLQDLRLMNQRIAEVTNLLPEGSRHRFTQQATGYLDKIAERIDQQRTLEVKSPVPAGVQAAARSRVSDQAESTPDQQVPIDPLAELRRQQSEMLDRLAKERGRSKHRERSDEQGD